MTPLKTIQELGQSIWLDYIRRGLILSGELDRMVQEDGLSGVTSNPSIFEKAIGDSADYANSLRGLLRQHDMEAGTLYERLAVRDIQDAADILYPVYERTGGRDGYVSLEVSPYLARDTEGTIEQARYLWNLTARPNVLIKVPATPEGIPAIQQLIGEGININVTLLFARETYVEVAEAYMSGLEELSNRGGDPSRVASVASFFISRIDTLVDKQICRKREEKSAAAGDRMGQLLGKVAIANAKLAYQSYKELIASPRWKKIQERGARPQRLLWASTSTKNKAYRDVVYVEEMIGPDTVNTIPPTTYDAFRDHGRARPSLEEGIEGARQVMADLEAAGISMREVADRLLNDGVQLFADAFDGLLGAVERKRREFLEGTLGRQSHDLPQPLAKAVAESLEAWRLTGNSRRLWRRDASLWTGADEAEWLGWLTIAEHQLAQPYHLTRIAEEAKSDGFSHVLLLGMGGSSLCPDVLRETFGTQPGFPELHVLDSTDPAQVTACEARIDMKRTLFIVSSKSGSTLEPNIFKKYFFERVKEALGIEEAGRRFIAITDPGSRMERVAAEDRFRHTFFGAKSVGGRYSALSNFGLVPAAAIGIDTRRFLEGALRMVRSCGPSVPAPENPGVVLGTILGVAACQGRDKVTLTASPGIAGLGAWIEQLLAESTGKQGKGIIPIDRETLGPPEIYGNDRLFVHLRLADAAEDRQDRALAALAQAGHPVVRIVVPEAYGLGAEFFRWEIATAVAGAIMGINPFDQPDVEASKLATRRLTDDYERTGTLPAETPILEENGIRLFTNDTNAAALREIAGSDQSLGGLLRAHLGRLGEGDYFSLLAYLEMCRATEEELQTIRHAVRDAKRTATCLGFGPRFLHSTGQAYKGGSNSGVFLQVTCDDPADLSVPGQSYTFGVVKAAQARGDFEVLAERDRRVLRVHLGKEIRSGLATLRRTIERALS